MARFWVERAALPCDLSNPYIRDTVFFKRRGRQDGNRSMIIWRLLFDIG